MTEYQVTTNQVRNKAEDLRGKNKQFQSLITDLEAKEIAMVGLWEGEAKEAFDRLFKANKAQFDTFGTTIEKFCQALEVIAGRYDNAEATNVATVQSNMV